MQSKSLLYSAVKADNLRLKKEITELKDTVASLRFQLNIAKEKIERRNVELSKLMAEQIVDLTSPPPSPKKRKRTASAIMDEYLESLDKDLWQGEEETKEEVEYIQPKRKLRF